jgi:glyoxylase-like metal-dependent hydrolase (beta-lactamase superfamily II)
MVARAERVVSIGPTHHGKDLAETTVNTWLLGDDTHVAVVDVGYDDGAVRKAVGARRVSMVACTHGHREHVKRAPALAGSFGAAVLLHPDDHELWHQTHPDTEPDGDLLDGQVLRVATVEIRVLHTPGHTSGSVCLYIPALASVCTGDTLITAGRDPRLLEAIHDRLRSLPPQTSVLPAHGEPTTLQRLAPDLAVRPAP